MKITVDIDDLYVEEGTITEELKRQIVYEAVSAIRKEITDTCRKAIIDEIKESAMVIINKAVKEEIAAALTTSYVKNQYSNTKPWEGRETVTLKEYANQIFTATSGWQSANEVFTKMGKEFGAECKKRYDLTFAASIVSSLKDNGLLKDERLMQLLTENINS